MRMFPLADYISAICEGSGESEGAFEAPMERISSESVVAQANAIRRNAHHRLN